MHHEKKYFVQFRRPPSPSSPPPPLSSYCSRVPLFGVGVASRYSVLYTERWYHLAGGQPPVLFVQEQDRKRADLLQVNERTNKRTTEPANPSSYFYLLLLHKMLLLYKILLLLKLLLLSVSPRLVSSRAVLPLFERDGPRPRMWGGHISRHIINSGASVLRKSVL